MEQQYFCGIQAPFASIADGIIRMYCHLFFFKFCAHEGFQLLNPQ